MGSDRIEGKWLDAFEEVFRLAGAKAGDTVAVLSETQSRPVLVQLSELALQRIGCAMFHTVVPTPPVADPVPIRSTGASFALGGIGPLVDCLGATDLVIDCTVEGLLHAPELGRILAGGTRVQMISNEHPEILERCKPDPAVMPAIAEGVRLLREASEMKVSSAAGTDLTVRLGDAPVKGSAGLATQPSTMAYWPGGLCLCFPRPNTVSGRVVMDVGDVNLTFKRYLESPVILDIDHDYVVNIGGDGLDAQLMRSYISAWDDADAYAVSHVGWGMNPAARWDSLIMYDKAQINGTELRAFAGNFLFSTGANEHAGRFTRGHFDLPLRNCTIHLDDRLIVDSGRLCPPLVTGPAAGGAA